MSQPRLLPADSAGLEEAARLLRAGGLVAFPTESSFGLAASLEVPGALERLVQLKGRTEGHPFPVLVGAPSQALELLCELPEDVAGFVESVWPGPLTLVAPARRALHPSVVSSLGVGVRVPGWQVALDLARLAGPVTATSANRSGEPPCQSHEEVLETFSEGLDAVIQGRAGGGAPSTVAALRAWGLQVLRPGPVSVPEALEVTGDTIFGGGLQVLQPKVGYRFSVDALLLAAFAADLAGSRRLDRVCDLGTGCGVVLVALSRWVEAEEFVGIEVQERLARLAELNLAQAVADRGRVLVADWREAGLLPARSMDLVVSNPPFRKAGTGRPSPNQERDRAVYAHHGDLPELMAAAARWLAPEGLLAVVLPAERFLDAVEAMATQGLRLVAVRSVHPFAGRRASRVLLAAVPASSRRPLQWLPPLILHEAPGRDTEELEAILAGRPRRK